MTPADYRATDAPRESLHEWFGLSYASWLTIPRSVLQSMPAEWQHRFLMCLEEMDTQCADHGVDLPATRVLGAHRGYAPVVKDLGEYQRGRRRLW